MMSRLIRSWMLLLAASATLLFTGCPARTEKKPPERKSERRDAGTTAHKEAAPQTEKSPERSTAKHEPEHAQPAPPPVIPKVILTEELRAACLVNVGDKMPDAELSDLHGKALALHSLFGKKLTVVCLWTIGDSERSKLLSAALLRDLTNGVLKPAGHKDAALVGINVGDSAAAVEQQLAKAEATFPNLLDPQGKFLAQVTKDQNTPRIFLLDANGRILWFDLENSRGSRRNLLQAIQVVLGKK